MHTFHIILYTYTKKGREAKSKGKKSKNKRGANNKSNADAGADADVSSQGEQGKGQGKKEREGTKGTLTDERLSELLTKGFQPELQSVSEYAEEEEKEALMQSLVALFRHRAKATFKSARDAAFSSIKR